MQAKQLITHNLKRILKKIAHEDVEFEVHPSEKSENGDYYTNVALRLGSILKQKPLDIAYKIKQEFDKVGDSDVVKKAEVAPPGFVNFFLSRQCLFDTMIRIIESKEKFGSSDSLKNKKIMVEFTDPNPFKEFHIGHLYSNIVGESLARLYESQDATVWRVCYQGDVGLHVAKAIYGMKKLSNQMPDDQSPLSVRAQFMGKAYALGSQDYEQNDKVKKEINDLNRKIYDLPAGRQGKDSSIRDLYEKGKIWSLDYFGAIYKRLGTEFKKFYFESEVGEPGAKLVREFFKKGVFKESEGAIIFEGAKFGLHNRVFVNSLGLPTYEAKDLGLAPFKYRDFAYDRSIIITAQEQADYFKVVLAALEQINPELAKKTHHISHGMVRLPGGKMSSRTGDIITGEWLIEETVEQIHRAYPEMDAETGDRVGLAAVKYALLKNAIGQDTEFDFSESITLNGASGPYLQYAYVRTKSVLEKNQKSKTKDQKQIAENSLNSEELAVLRHLAYFPEIVQMAQEKLSPNIVASYLFGLSQKFNLFYQKHKIAGNKFRLELTEATGQVLKNGLALLGIETVDRM